MSVTLPGWANQHFWVQENGSSGVRIICSPEEHKFFRAENNKLKELCSFSEWSYIPREHIKIIIQSYILYNLCMGLIDHQRALERQAEGT